MCIILLVCHASVPAKTAVDVAIIGGGPCGLATALALRHSAPTAAIAVFERDPDLTPKGSSVVISPSGWAALRCVDCTASKRLRQLAVPIESVTILPLEEGGSAAAPGFARSALRVLESLNRGLRACGLPRLGIVRANRWSDVRDALASRVQELCGDEALHLGCRLTSLAEAPGSGGFALTFERCGGHGDADGDGVATGAVTASVVLACDGTRSTVRSLSPRGYRNDDVLVDEGKSVWRGIAPDVDLKGACTVLRDTNRSDGALAITFPAGGGGGASWTVAAPRTEGYSRSSEEARRRLLASLPPQEEGCTYAPLAALRRCIDESPVIIENRLKVPSATARTNPIGSHPINPIGSYLVCILPFIMSRPHSGSLPPNPIGSRPTRSCFSVGPIGARPPTHPCRWRLPQVRTFGNGSPPFSSPINGIAYLGDSAHPVRPTGEGIALAFEDAWQLGEIVKQSPDQLPNVDMLRAYESARLPYVRSVSEKVRSMADAYYEAGEDGEDQREGAEPSRKKALPRLRPKPLWER